MKSNTDLFKKAYNNQFSQNGSDVSSTADDLMRNDIGDGVSIEGEGKFFRMDHQDESPNYQDESPNYQDEAPLSELDTGFFDEPESSNYEMDAEAQLTDISANDDVDIPMDEPERQFSNCDDAINMLSSLENSLNDTPYINLAPPVSNYALGENELPTVGIAPSINANMYSQFREALSGFDDYLGAIFAAALCSTGIGNELFEMSNQSLMSFIDNQNCRVLPQNIENDDLSNLYGQIVGQNNPTQGNYSLSNEQTEKVINAIARLTNFIKANPVNLGMVELHNDLQESSAMYQPYYSNQAISYPPNLNPQKAKLIFDYIKLSTIVEYVGEGLIMIGNCLPANIKLAFTECLAEFVMVNNRFIDIEVDEAGMSNLDVVFAGLDYPLPDNFLTLYTSYDYNALNSQLSEMASENNALMSDIGIYAFTLANVNAELSAMQQMAMQDQGQMDDLQSEIDELQFQSAEMESELIMFMHMLDIMQYDFAMAVEDNANMQAQLNASQSIIQMLEADLSQSEMNQADLQNMTNDLVSQISMGNATILQLNDELQSVISELHSELAMGESIQELLMEELDDSTSELYSLQSQLTTAISNLNSENMQLAQENALNEADIEAYQSQVANLVNTNQALVSALSQAESQTGACANDFGSGKIKVQGELDMKTGKGVIQIVGKPKLGKYKKADKIGSSLSKPKSIPKSIIRKAKFIGNNPSKDLINMPEFRA